jgi:uncharacterized protein (DUF433 family)
MELLPSVAVRVDERRSLVVHERIEVNPAVMLSKPVIRGTRITVELILRKLREGATAEVLAYLEKL